MIGDDMSQNIKKTVLRDETYIDKDRLKHKHDFTLKHLLIVTNVNKHASANYYNKKEYFYVLKCNQCNSFIPDSVEENFNHYILDNEVIDYSLPVITASTDYKCPHYNFSKLFDFSMNNMIDKGD